MTILTPKHRAMGAAQAALVAAFDLERYQRRVQSAEESRQADPLGDGTKLADWQPPASWGAITERIPCRRRGVPAECLRFAKHGEWVYRLTVKLHGVDG